MTAGPSEITIVCDKFSNPEWAASDLIGQAEHDPLAQCILISKDKNLIVAVNPNLSFANVLSLRQQINHPKLSITASNKTWHNRLQHMKIKD